MRDNGDAMNGPFRKLNLDPPMIVRLVLPVRWARSARHCRERRFGDIADVAKGPFETVSDAVDLFGRRVMSQGRPIGR
jgi:hypothetical protein